MGFRYVSERPRTPEIDARLARNWRAYWCRQPLQICSLTTKAETLYTLFNMPKTDIVASRVDPYERKQLEDAAEAMECSSSDALRIAIQLLRQQPADFFKARRAEARAWELVDRLCSQYGPHARVEFVLVPDQLEAVVAINGEEPEGIRATLDRGGDLLHLGIVDAKAEGDPEQIGIRGVAVLPVEGVSGGDSWSTTLSALYPQRGPDGGETVDRDGRVEPAQRPPVGEWVS